MLALAMQSCPHMHEVEASAGSGVSISDDSLGYACHEISYTCLKGQRDAYLRALWNAR